MFLFYSKLREVFDDLDSDNCGTISLKDVSKGLHILLVMNDSNFDLL